MIPSCFHGDYLLYVAVPWKNPRLFCHVFRSHRCLRSAVSLNTSVKGEAHLCFLDSWAIHASTKHVWALPLMEVQRYGASNTVMWSKYVTEQPSISTRDCHICFLTYLSLPCFQVDMGAVPATLVNFVSKRQPLAIAYLRDYLISTSLHISSKESSPS